MSKAVLITLISALSGLAWGGVVLSRYSGVLSAFDGDNAARQLAGIIWRVLLQAAFLFGLPLLTFAALDLLPLRRLELLLGVLPAFLVTHVAYRVVQRRKLAAARAAGLVAEDQL